MEFTDEDVRSLVETLDGLELPNGQRQALHALFEAASRNEDEVSGYLGVPDVLPGTTKPKPGAPKSLLDYDWIAIAARKPRY